MLIMMTKNEKKYMVGGKFYKIRKKDNIILSFLFVKTIAF